MMDAFGKTRPDSGTAAFGQDHRSHPPDRNLMTIGRKFQKPTDGLEEPFELASDACAATLFGASAGNGRERGWRSACCCAGLKLLLLDEPVAGMTDDETDAHRRAVHERWPASTAGRGRARHGLRRGQLGGKVTVLREGSVLAEGISPRCQAIRA